MAWYRAWLWTDQLVHVQIILEGFALTFRETKPVIAINNATCIAFQIMRTAPSPLLSVQHVARGHVLC